MLDAPAIVGALEGAGYRLTAPRRALAALIASRRGHFTADELLAESRRGRLGLGRATIFRSLDVLADLGVVERLDLPSGGHAFVACEPVHHHHVVCSSCGRSTGVSDHGLELVAAAIGRETGYRVDTHRLELFGRCTDCQAAGAAPVPERAS
jgi:Fur family ferric uptake transcriptional regulator